VSSSSVIWALGQTSPTHWTFLAVRYQIILQSGP